jgi:glycine cleavage system aminomethyltransferase T
MKFILRDSTLYAEDMWNAVLDAGKKHSLMVIAPAHHRRIQAGILSWGQDMDHQHNPFQCNLVIKFHYLEKVNGIKKQTMLVKQH